MSQSITFLFCVDNKNNNYNTLDNKCMFSHLQSINIWQKVFLWNLDILHDNLACSWSPQRKFPFNLRSRQSFHSLKKHKQQYRTWGNTISLADAILIVTAARLVHLKKQWITKLWFTLETWYQKVALTTWQKQKTKRRTFIMSSKTMLCACLTLPVVKTILISWKCMRILDKGFEQSL